MAYKTSNVMIVSPGQPKLSGAFFRVGSLSSNSFQKSLMTLGIVSKTELTVNGL